MQNLFYKEKYRTQKIMDDCKESRHYKLIRDHVPKLLEAKGIKYCTRILDQEDYENALTDKLQEEVCEYIQAKGNEQQIEELTDIMELIKAILEHKGIDFSVFEIFRKKKHEMKGGFSQRLYLEKTFSQQSDKRHITECIFCRRNTNGFSNIEASFSHCYVLKDANPVSPGHLLIIPYEHTPNWFTASQEARFDIIKVLDRMKSKLDLEYQPDGYNIGINCGRHAGQSVMHLHVHLIPRYHGDMDNPKGGVRGAIPEKQKY